MSTTRMSSKTGNKSTRQKLRNKKILIYLKSYFRFCPPFIASITWFIWCTDVDSWALYCCNLFSFCSICRSRSFCSASKSRCALRKFQIIKPHLRLNFFLKNLAQNYLTHSFTMQPFSTPWKYQGVESRVHFSRVHWEQIG